MAWQQTLEKTVTGLGYDLVDLERAPRGLLRVYIDRVPGQSYPTGAGEFITVDDCERVTRQLQSALEVEGFDYSRLEVSSPGLDRPLRHESDYVRFSGQEIELTLREAFQGRKKYRGVLSAREGGWRLVLADVKSEQALDFTLDEVRESRLVPVINFKGRAAAPATREPDQPAAAGHDGQVDGEQIQ